MVARAPLSHHLDLYRYWERKRSGDGMPRRRDVDPMEIPRLLPHLALIERTAGGYRWRLIGTHVVEDLGCDLTGEPFGTDVGPWFFVRAMTATFDRVLDRGEPAFEASVYITATGNSHVVSRLVLPLAADGRTPAMVLCSRITRWRPLDRPANHMKGASGRIVASAAIRSAEELARVAAAWEEGARPAKVATVCAPRIIRVANLWGGGLPRFADCGSSNRLALTSTG